MWNWVSSLKKMLPIQVAVLNLNNITSRKFFITKSEALNDLSFSGIITRKVDFVTPSIDERARSDK